MKYKEHDDPPKPDVINLHMVPHSHTDAGWIEPIDWYYENWVKHIFDNILEEMEESYGQEVFGDVVDDITFVWADTNYLHQWYESQNSEVQERFQKVVQRGQIEFVGGGWVQNDESLSDLKSIVNQMNTGLQYLHDKFNATPTVGWQIDPFGYNHFMPGVFKELGYDYLVLNRIGDLRKEGFKEEQSMDFWLNPAKLGQSESEVLTHVLPRHYEPVDFDGLLMRVPDCESSEKDKKKLVEYFYETYLKEQVKGYSTEEFMMLMGKDFGFRDSRKDLGRIARLNRFITQYSKEVVGIQINANFSHPSKYFKAIEDSKKLTHKSIDFLNYDERLVYLHPNKDFEMIDYWVGYYFTRPMLKKRINKAFNSFRTLETLYSYAKSKGEISSEVSIQFWEVEKQLSYMLHHDAITGTSRIGTIEDYYSRIEQAETRIDQMMETLSSILLEQKTSSNVLELPSSDSSQMIYFNQASYERNVILKFRNDQHLGQNLRIKDPETGKYLH
jgi:lysosomal alpha-mannosidase